MTTYNELASDLDRWMARDDLGARFNSFLVLAEAEIRRKVRVMAMQARDSAFAIASGEAALPTGFLGFRSVAYVINNNLVNRDAELTYEPPDRFFEKRRSQESELNYVSAGGTYTILDDKIFINPSETASTLDITYFVAFTALTDSNTTNWLLTNHYDIYLNLVLSHAWRYVGEPQEADYHQAQAYLAIEEMQRAEERKQRSGGPKVRHVRGTTP